MKTWDEMREKIGLEGGSIVSSNDCSSYEISTARSCGRMYVDERHYGYIWRPKIKVEENARLREALETSLLLLEHGDFTNGVTDGTATIDEGATKAGWMIDEIRQVLKQFP
jgi:hypothetical protein